MGRRDAVSGVIEYVIRDATESLALVILAFIVEKQERLALSLEMVELHKSYRKLISTRDEHIVRLQKEILALTPPADSAQNSGSTNGQ